MYAKLVNGQLVTAPTNFRGIINYCRFPERMVEDGYKPVVYTAMPADGIPEYDEETLEIVKEAEKSYESSFEETEHEIVQVWHEKA